MMIKPEELGDFIKFWDPEGKWTVNDPIDRVASKLAGKVIKKDHVGVMATIANSTHIVTQFGTYILISSGFYKDMWFHELFLEHIRKHDIPFKYETTWDRTGEPPGEVSYSAGCQEIYGRPFLPFEA